jgi:phosphomannomutase
MTLRETLSYTPVELGFGTSGLRGLVTDMTDLECYINIVGFLEFLLATDDLKIGAEVYIAGDLRMSTPRIMQVVAEACRNLKLTPINCGLIPTPAVACYALAHNAPCIMVTGSHIPNDRNGIKFYKHAGEILKSDETDIQMYVAQTRKRVYQQADDLRFTSRGMFAEIAPLGAVLEEAETAYVNRYLGFFPTNCFVGKELVVYQHSAVGRDMLVKLLEGLGAQVLTVERSDEFVSIDTENITLADKERFKKFASAYPDAFATVSTDGDSDRPFVIDETGVFHRGDVLGCVVAKYLGAKFAAVPISSNDAVGAFCKTNAIDVVETKIGSPYVISAMYNAPDNKKPIVSWEVNGGFLTGSDIVQNGQTLTALPTRDAFLPIICSLLSATQNKKQISELFAELPKRYTGGGLVDDVQPDKITHFKELCQNQSEVEVLVAEVFGDSDLGAPTKIDLTDGLRLIFDQQKVIHLRPSGNAPQFRVYTNAVSQQGADVLAEKSTTSDGGYIQKLLERLWRP